MKRILVWILVAVLAWSQLVERKTECYADQRKKETSIAIGEGKKEDEIFGVNMEKLNLKSAPGKEEKEAVGSLYAQSAVLMDGSSGRVLYEKNGKEFLANASTTKILTCILALEKAKPEDIVSVSSYAASMPDVQLHIQEGEKYLLKDLLYSLMLESHNEIGRAHV